MDPESLPLWCRRSDLSGPWQAVGDVTAEAKKTGADAYGAGEKAATDAKVGAYKAK